ncbi:MAG: DUF5723 family protein [candidate division WOR-3 bacterium]
MSYVVVFVVSGLLNPVLASGPNAMEFNPAQLAYPERTGMACRILGVAGEVWNNSFSMAQYKRYNGAFLDERAKAEIVGSIPPTGFRAAGRFDARAVEFGYGCLAASIRTTGTGGLTLPKDVFELVLYGNELGRTYRAEPLNAEAQVLLQAGVAGATAVGRALTVGAAVRYLRGTFCAELTEGSGYFLTTPEALIADGQVAYHTATGGSGWAFDAGATCQLGEWRISVAALDLSPGIRWCEGVEEWRLVFALDSVNAYQLVRGGGARADFGRQPRDGFTTYTPVQVNLGLGRRFGERANGCITIRSLTRLQPEARLSTTVRPAVAAELWPTHWLGTGAGLSYEHGRGVGLEISWTAVWRHLRLEAGLEDIAGPVMRARGAAARLSLYYTGLPAGTRTRRSDILRLVPGVN